MQCEVEYLFPGRKYRRRYRPINNRRLHHVTCFHPITTNRKVLARDNYFIAYLALSYVVIFVLLVVVFKVVYYLAKVSRVHSWHMVRTEIYTQYFRNISRHFDIRVSPLNQYLCLWLLIARVDNRSTERSDCNCKRCLCCK